MTGDPRWAPPPSECLSSDERRHQQFIRLTGLLGAVDGTNRFYTEKFLAAGVNLSEIRTLEDLARLPLTTKQERVGPGSHPSLGHRAHRTADPLHPLSPNFVHHRPATPLARHSGKLALGRRLLAFGVPRRPHRERRHYPVPVRLRTIPRVLVRLRRGDSARGPSRAGWGHVERDPA